MSSEKLLRAYIRELLAENDGHAGGDGGAGAVMAMGAGMSPYGMHYGDNDDMYKIFVKPFTDIIHTAAGKTKELSRSAQTLTKVAFEAIATSLIPVLSSEYGEIFKKEKIEMDKIRKQYGEIYKANWDAFKDNDVLAAAFMYSPTGFLTLQFARKAPGAAAKMISILSGGQLDGFLKKIANKFPNFNTPGGPTGLGRHADGPGALESVIREDEGKQKPDAAALLSSKKVKDALQNSKVVRQMEQQGRAIIRSTLEQVFKQAQGVLTAKTLQDIQQKTGAKLKGLDKLAQVPEQERAKLEQTILDGAKKSMKSFYVKNLQAQVKQALDGGISQDSPYVQDYQNVIRKIEAL
jgi:hypothetical protein